MRRLRIASLFAAVVGLVLFAWSLQHAGTAAVVDGIKRVGIGIVIVIALGGVRAFVRTAAWRLCLDPEDRMRLRSMFAAYLAGDAIGNVTPFGFLISEPSKIVMVRGRIAMQASVASLTVENLFYSATVIVMLVAGIAALVLSFPLSRLLMMTCVIVLLMTLVLAGLVAWILATRRRVVSDVMEWLVRHGIASSYMTERLPRVRQTGDRIFGFIARRPGAVIPVLLLEVAFHVAGIVEVWFALGLITGLRPPLVTAFVLEAVNRTITVVFQFVPMWIGVDEAGTAAVTSAVNLGSAAGVSLALVRKARLVTWTAIGLLGLLHHGVSVGDASQRATVLTASDEAVR